MFVPRAREPKSIILVIECSFAKETISLNIRSGGDFDGFYWDVKEKTHSLLMFDIVQADVSISDELKEEIEKDGVVIYEKA